MSTAPPAHDWTAAQTVDLVEFIQRDPALAQLIFDPKGDQAAVVILQQKKLCLQLLQRTAWMEWMRREQWVVLGDRGLKPTEKWGKESPVADRLDWLQYEHVRLCSRLKDFGSPGEMARDSPERRIWEEYRKKKNYDWYFTYHRVWLQHSPAAIRARAAAQHPHALAVSSSLAGRIGYKPSSSRGSLADRIAPAPSGDSDDDGIVLLESQAGPSTPPLAARIGSGRIFKKTESAPDTACMAGPSRLGTTPLRSASSSSLGKRIGTQPDLGRTSPTKKRSTDSSRATSLLATRMGAIDTHSDAHMKTTLGEAGSRSHRPRPELRQPSPRLPIQTAAASVSLPTAKATAPRSRTLSSRFDPRPVTPPLPPRVVSRSPSPPHSRTPSSRSDYPRAADRSSAITTPSPDLVTPPCEPYGSRQAANLAKLLEPRKFARDAALERRLRPIVSVPPIPTEEGADESDEHWHDDSSSSTAGDVRLEEDHYGGILLDHDGPPLVFDLLGPAFGDSGHAGAPRVRLSLDGVHEDYRPLTPPLPFSVGTVSLELSMRIPLPDMGMAPSDPPLGSEDVYEQSSACSTKGRVHAQLDRNADSSVSSLDVHQHPNQTITPRLVYSPQHDVVTTVQGTKANVHQAVMDASRMGEDDDDDDVVYMGTLSRGEEDAFLAALRMAIGL